MIQHRPDDSAERKLLHSLSLYSVRLKYLERKSFFGLSGRQVLLLASVCSFENPPTLTEIATANNASHQNMKQILLKLEERGFINLVDDERDNRIIRAVITEEGEVLCSRYRKTIDKLVRELLGDVPEKKIESAREVIELIYDRMERLV